MKTEGKCIFLSVVAAKAYIMPSQAAHVIKLPGEESTDP